MLLTYSEEIGKLIIKCFGNSKDSISKTTLKNKSKCISWFKNIVQSNSNEDKVVMI